MPLPQSLCHSVVSVVKKRNLVKFRWVLVEVVSLMPIFSLQLSFYSTFEKSLPSLNGAFLLVTGNLYRIFRFTFPYQASKILQFSLWYLSCNLEILCGSSNVKVPRSLLEGGLNSRFSAGIISAGFGCNSQLANIKLILFNQTFLYISQGDGK